MSPSAVTSNARALGLNRPSSTRLVDVLNCLGCLVTVLERVPLWDFVEVVVALAGVIE